MPPRNGTHIRGNRISGDPNRLNDKAIKVLAVVRFARASITREELIRDTSLTRADVERQVKLLLHLNLIKNNSRFPPFPQTGWRVFTEEGKNIQILHILRQHGFIPPSETASRALLGDYYPTGLALDGVGQQPNRGGSNYTEGVPIIEELEYRPSTIAILKKFRSEKHPFKPKVYSLKAVEEKKKKWKWFIKTMATNHGIPQPTVTFGPITEESWNKEGSSTTSFYNPSTHTLQFNGKFSLITLLHEYGHARGFDERDTIIWSLNAMKRYWPKSFSRLQGEEGTHLLLRQQQQSEFEL